MELSLADKSNNVTRSVFRSFVDVPRFSPALAPVASDCGARTELSAPALPDVVDETDGGPIDGSNPEVDGLAWCSLYHGPVSGCERRGSSMIDECGIGRCIPDPVKNDYDASDQKLWVCCLYENGHSCRSQLSSARLGEP